MNEKKYKELYRKVAEIVNNSDPNYYNGPEDEYDSEINEIIKTINSDLKINFERVYEIFFTGVEDVTEEQKDKVNKIVYELNLVNTN